MSDIASEIELAKRTVVTDSLSFSINEFVTMYAEGEIEIHPAFQRLFRWGPEQQANLIESILIGVPLPTLFVYERSDGIWELVDGLQRASTILKFLGQLKSPDGNYVKASVLRETKYLNSLSGMVWDVTGDIESTDAHIHELPSAQKLSIKRARINIEVLKQPSSPDAKHDLFQRLNRGGSMANDQELRNCVMVMRDPDFARTIIALAEEDRFKQLCRISDDAVIKQTHVEYMTRLVCHMFFDLSEGSDLNEFLDDSIDILIKDGRKEEVATAVRMVIDVVFDAVGAEGLLPTTGRRIFTLRGLESILVGVGRNRQGISALPNPTDFVADKISSFWKDSSNQIFTASGMSAAERTKKTIPVGESWFRP